MNVETQEWAEVEATAYAKRFANLMGPMLQEAALYGIERGIERAERESDEICEQCMIETERNQVEAEREAAKDDADECDCDLRKACRRVISGMDEW